MAKKKTVTQEKKTTTAKTSNTPVFNEKEVIGILSENEGSDWVVRLARLEVIDKKGSKEYFDIRNVKESNDPDKKIYGKGISLTQEELENLYNLLKDLFE